MPDGRCLVQLVVPSGLGKPRRAGVVRRKWPDIAQCPAIKLQQIAGAFHQYHAAYQAFTRPRLQDQKNVAEGQASVYTELSWRVHLLPYLDQLPLYEKFHLDEPWDSPHNHSLIEKMPRIRWWPYQSGQRKQ